MSATLGWYVTALLHLAGCPWLVIVWTAVSEAVLVCTVYSTVQVYSTGDCTGVVHAGLRPPHLHPAHVSHQGAAPLLPCSSLQCEVHLILFQSVQAWQAEGVPVAAVDKTEDSVELNKTKEKRDEN